MKKCWDPLLCASKDNVVPSAQARMMLLEVRGWKNWNAQAGRKEHVLMSAQGIQKEN